MIRAENRRMQEWLAAHGITARAKWLAKGSLKRTWRLYDPSTPWSLALAHKLNALGFRDYNNRPLDVFSGNGGAFSVFVRGHEELLLDPPAEGEPVAWGENPHDGTEGEARAYLESKRR